MIGAAGRRSRVRIVAVGLSPERIAPRGGHVTLIVVAAAAPADASRPHPVCGIQPARRMGAAGPLWTGDGMAIAPGETLHVGAVDTPLGRVWIATSEHGVRAVTVPGGTRDDCLGVAVRASTSYHVGDGGDLVERAAAELRDYFSGALRAFSLPLDLRGTTFQRRVWDAVAAIPYGDTSTYREIAIEIGAPNAYRAVGAANGANPAAIVIPCHRVVGSDGSLIGYGGGLARKRALQDLERHVSRSVHDISQ